MTTTAHHCDFAIKSYSGNDDSEFQRKILCCSYPILSDGYLAVSLNFTVINTVIEYFTIMLLITNIFVILQTLKAIQNDNDNDMLTVSVLDVDTISQVKKKILDAMFRNKPYSYRPAPDDVDLGKTSSYFLCIFLLKTTLNLL